jgi:hypothetical protein
MANTYSWKIQSLIYDVGPDSEGHSDVVIQIESKLIASDGEDPPVEASSWVTTKVTWEEGDQWIPYGDLVESDVVGWDALGRGRWSLIWLHYYPCLQSLPPLARPMAA